MSVPIQPGCTLDVAKGSTDLVAETITTREGLAACAGVWNELLEQSAACHIFLRWEWISVWLDVMGSQAPPHVVVVRERSGRIVAIAPFYRTRLCLTRLVNYRCLRIMGDVESGAEYPDIIVHSDREEEAIPLVAAALVEHRDTWDCLWLPRMAGGRGARERIECLAKHADLHLHHRLHDFSGVALPDTHEAYLKSLSKHARKAVRWRTNQLQRKHEVELVLCGEKDELEEMLPTFFDLHHRRWSTCGEEGSFVRQPKMEQFYRRFAPIALERGWLRFYALRVDGTLRAFQFGYAYRGTLYQLQGAWDPDVIPRANIVLRNLVFEACIKEGLCVFDFLGGYSEDKERSGAERKSGHDMFMGRRCLKNAMLFAKEIWPTGRFLVDTRDSDTKVTPPRTET